MRKIGGVDMPLLTWKDGYSVNNEELDNHHKTLMTTLNSLYAECLEVDSDGCVGPKLDAFLAFADYHFTAEEEYMRSIQYFEIDAHIEQHRGFAYKLAEMKRVQCSNEIELTRELITFIGKWLLHHVFEEDKKYALHAASGVKRQV